MGSTRLAPPKAADGSLSIRVAMLAEFPALGSEAVGGPQVAVGRLVRKLVECGLDLVIVAPDMYSSDETVAQLPKGGTLVRVPAGGRWALARGLQPWRKRAAEVVVRLGADVVHGQGLLPAGIAAGDVEAGAPIVVTARGNAREDTAAEYSGVGGMARAYLRDRLAGAAVERADAVIGVNPDWTVNIPRRPRRFVYIPNMIDEDFFDRTREPAPPLVLFAGGTRGIKGWALLAEAWPRVCEAIPEARLQVVNWPPGTVPPGIPSRHRDSIAVEGPLSSAALTNYMVQATTLVIPSKFEVSPIVLAEAWALELPVVATRVGGIPALAEGAAVLADRHPELLAASLVSALTGGELIDELVAEGRRRAEAHRPDAVASAHVSLYDELLSSGRS
jgi:glycosyltransferase involved in cell wall biosynthesis